MVVGLTTVRGFWAAAAGLLAVRGLMSVLLRGFRLEAEVLLVVRDEELVGALVTRRVWVVVRGLTAAGVLVVVRGRATGAGFGAGRGLVTVLLLAFLGAGVDFFSVSLML